MRGIRALFVTVLCLSALACGGKTEGQVVTEYGDRYAALVAKIEKLVATLPPPGSVTENKGDLPLDPPLVYDQVADEYNCDIIHLEQVKDSEAELPFDLLLSYDLARHLLWTAPDSFMRKREDSAGTLAERLDATLARRYVVVHRAVEVVLPEAIDHGSYKPGRAAFEGFVLDLVADKVVGSYRISARTHAEAGYSGGTMDSMIASVRSGMWTMARDKVKEALTEVTGGKVVLD